MEIQRRVVMCGLLALIAGLSSPAPLLAQAAPQAPGFVGGTEDLPLMPDLTESPGGVVFDTPAGRIVETYASGRTDRERVLDFYAETLPQLGWRAEGRSVFRREGEVLQLDVSDEAGRTVVRFRLKPE